MRLGDVRAGLLHEAWIRREQEALNLHVFVAGQRVLQVAVLPAGVALHVEHLDPLVDHPHPTRDLVVVRRQLIRITSRKSWSWTTKTAVSLRMFFA